MALIVAAGSVITIGAQFLREWRNRKWEQQDRDRRTLEAHVVAEEHAAALAVKVEASETRVLDRIDQNTEISVAAFKEANNINAKIASIGLQAIDGEPIAPEGK